MLGMLLKIFCIWLLISLFHVWSTLLTIYEKDVVGATLAIYLNVPPEKGGCGVSLRLIPTTAVPA